MCRNDPDDGQICTLGELITQWICHQPVTNCGATMPDGRYVEEMKCLYVGVGIGVYAWFMLLTNPFKIPKVTLQESDRIL